MTPKARSKTRKGTRLQRGTMGWIHSHKFHIAAYLTVPFIIDILLFFTIRSFKLEAVWAYTSTRLYNTAMSMAFYILSDTLLMLGLAMMCYGGVKYWTVRKTTEALRICLCGLYTVVGACTLVYWCFTVSIMFEVWLKYTMEELGIPFNDMCGGWLYPCLDDLNDFEL